jgi:hypothetical protein
MPSSFNWANKVNAIVIPVALVAPTACAPHNFLALHSNTWNLWGSLSQSHHHSQMCTCKSFYSCKYMTNHAYNHATSPLPLVPIQLVKTVWHPHGIVSKKPVIKTTALSSASIPPMHPSGSTFLCQPISTVHSDSALCGHLVPFCWIGAEIPFLWVWLGFWKFWVEKDHNKDTTLFVGHICYDHFLLSTSYIQPHAITWWYMLCQQHQTVDSLHISQDLRIYWLSWQSALISRLLLWASIFNILIFSMDYDIATALDSYIWLCTISWDFPQTIVMLHDIPHCVLHFFALFI